MTSLVLDEEFLDMLTQLETYFCSLNLEPLISYNFFTLEIKTIVFYM